MLRDIREVRLGVIETAEKGPAFVKDREICNNAGPIIHKSQVNTE
ncbi:unnamed protein product, partial [marine sediment metagenome]